VRKYLFVAANEGPAWAGSEPLWINAAARLANLGNEVRVSVPQLHERNPQLGHLKGAGCQMFYRPGFPPFLYRMRRRMFSLPDYKRTHLRSVAADADLVVISQSDNGDGLAWMQDAHTAGCKYAVISQGAIPYCWPDDHTSCKLAESYEQASGAFFVSRSLLDLSRNQFATPLTRGKVVRNPFNVRYEANPAWPETDKDELLLACVARLDAAVKGHDLLLQVLGLPHWRERRIRLSMVGSGPHEHILRAMAARLGLNNVDFHGHRSDIENVWTKHHALVLASRFEGMPLVVVEAMLCGRPCIATDVGGSRELIRDGINGFLARAATVEFLDEAMNRAWDNRARLREIGGQAFADARCFVSADPIADFVQELEQIADGSHT
jgi:glycosyltransferase involved in cell wall biosynthesis